MFKRFTVLALLCAGFATGSAFAAGAIENPQPDATESGIGVISGWNCQASAITIQVDNAAPVVAPYGSLRGDTASVCGGRIATGFSYLINYNNLAPGAHVVRAYADGVSFGSVSFKTTNLGVEFLSGKAGEYYLQNFPAFGTRTKVTWQESKQNFVITGSDTSQPPIGGTFYGGVTSTNSTCATAGNNGSFFEVDRFTVTYGTNAVMNIELANTSNTCNYSGTAFYSTSGGDVIVPAGTFSCSSGFGGTWAATRVVFDPIGLFMDFTAKYTVGESCSTVGHIGAAR